ncbi:hypothetical protein CDL15_Pgr004707 [Punica granatum]|uniref:MADS-box domain-containing protein n=1 Tax=Punica granatum TaxID=22663 RepID=A0A218W629_PUNGR|nr:hypothetical protein CDL15_Pgr004707 [Punica granatum]
MAEDRAGLFSKATELSLLCGAEVAIITYSPHGNRPYVFGYPSVDATIHRFAGVAQATNTTGAFGNPSGDDRLNEYRHQYSDLVLQLEEARKRQKLGQGPRWWEGPTEDQDVEDLKRYIECMEKLTEKAGQRLEELRSTAVAAPISATTCSSDSVVVDLRKKAGFHGDRHD